MSADSEFYVGYQAEAPAKLGRWMRIVVALIITEALVFGLLVLMLEKPFDPGVFEFGVVKEFTGIIAAEPVPTLLAAQGVGEAASPMPVSDLLLVAQGKRTATPLIADFDGQRVALEGSLIYRDRMVMIEVRPDSVRSMGTESLEPLALSTTQSRGRAELSGEIVDAKCFLGVMKPGREKTHRSCAARCISGGIPPLLATTTHDGEEVFYVLLDADGATVNDRVLDFVAEPIAIAGEIRSHGSQLYLLADLQSIRRTSE